VPDHLRKHVRDLLAPDYDIGDELGRGGMAVVYSAVHRRDHRRVAIKVLPPHLAFNASARERFVREARLAAALNHPRIVPVYAAALRDDIAWFAMALVEGESLGKRLARDQQFSIADAQSILAQVADALSYAHAAGVVHRDIKPDNILLDAATGRPIVTDFGIARALDDDAHITLEGAALGTPSYMSPEQALGKSELDGRADIYSLGVVGYQLLTGRLPFTALNTPALLTKQVSERPAPLLELRPDTPLSMVEAIHRALEKKPAARWPSAAAFRGALGELPEPIAGIVPLPDFASRQVSGGAAVRIEIETVVRHIIRFRRKAVGSALLVCIFGVLNFLYDPDFPIFPLIAGMLALNLVVIGSALYAEDVPLYDLFIGKIRSYTTNTHPRVQHASASPYTARHELAQRGAARDHAEIRRMLDTLSDDERALIPGVDANVDALHHRIELLVTELRQLGPHANAEAGLTGSLLSRLDSAVDAMHVVRLDLMNLRDARFERGLDAFNLTSERARALTLEIDRA
jgi:hypothetical protein